MSDTTSGSGRLSLNKTRPNAGSAAPRRAGLFGRPASAEPVEQVTPPLTVKIIVVSLLTIVLCNIIIAVLWRLPGFVDQLTGVLAKSNADSSKPKAFYDTVSALHTARTSLAITAGIMGIAFVLLAWAMLRTRSASGSRWALLIIVIFTGTYGSVVPGKGLPVALQVVGVITGVAAILALVLTFVPPASQRYFRACKLAATPEHLRGQARPGLGSLFGPKRQRPGAAGGATRPGAAARGADRPAANRPADATNRPTAGKAKAKVRSDSDAVARGAELARSRAKASKSRRTE